VVGRAARPFAVDRAIVAGAGRAHCLASSLSHVTVVSGKFSAIIRPSTAVPKPPFNSIGETMDCEGGDARRRVQGSR